jgi:hypothetical protein
MYFGSTWAADGQALFVTGVITAPVRTNFLVRMTLDGAVQMLASGREVFEQVSPSPDGRHLAYSVL